MGPVNTKQVVLASSRPLVILFIRIRTCIYLLIKLLSSLTCETQYGTVCLHSCKNLGIVSFQRREKLQNWILAVLVLLRLFTIINEKCLNAHAPSTVLFSY